MREKFRARLERPPRGVVHFLGSRGAHFAVFGERLACGGNPLGGEGGWCSFMGKP